MAAYKVLDELRPNETVLICYPALTAKVDENVEFVQKYPTLVIDGCEKNAQEIFLPNLIHKWFKYSMLQNIKHNFLNWTPKILSIWMNKWNF